MHYGIQLYLQQPSLFLAEAPPAAPGLTDLLFPIAIMVFIFWLIVFRPEAKKRKERQRMIEALKKGDRVMTTGGIIGQVWKADGPEITLRIDKDKDIKVRFARSAILEVLGDVADGAKKGPSEDSVRELEQRAKS